MSEDALLKKFSSDINKFVDDPKSENVEPGPVEVEYEVYKKLFLQQCLPFFLSIERLTAESFGIETEWNKKILQEYRDEYVKFYRDRVYFQELTPLELENEECISSELIEIIMNEVKSKQEKQIIPDTFPHEVTDYGKKIQTALDYPGIHLNWIDKFSEKFEGNKKFSNDMLNKCIQMNIVNDILDSSNVDRELRNLFVDKYEECINSKLEPLVQKEIQLSEISTKMFSSSEGSEDDGDEGEEYEYYYFERAMRKEFFKSFEETYIGGRSVYKDLYIEKKSCLELQELIIKKLSSNAMDFEENLGSFMLGDPDLKDDGFGSDSDSEEEGEKKKKIEKSEIKVEKVPEEDSEKKKTGGNVINYPFTLFYCKLFFLNCLRHQCITPSEFKSFKIEVANTVEGEEKKTRSDIDFHFKKSILQKYYGEIYFQDCLRKKIQFGEGVQRPSVSAKKKKKDEENEGEEEESEEEELDEGVIEIVIEDRTNPDDIKTTTSVDFVYPRDKYVPVKLYTSVFDRVEKSYEREFERVYKRLVKDGSPKHLLDEFHERRKNQESGVANVAPANGDAKSSPVIPRQSISKSLRMDGIGKNKKREMESFGVGFLNKVLERYFRDDEKVSPHFMNFEGEGEDGLTIEFLRDVLLEQYFKEGKPIEIKYLYYILLKGENLLRNEQNVIQVTDLKCPLVVVGDLHAQLHSLLHILGEAGWPGPDLCFVFNGDFIDKAAFPTEVVLMLLTLKILYPRRVFLTRGNHENEVDDHFGFPREVKSKYKTNHFVNLFFNIFSALPISVVINKSVMVIHAGIGSKHEYTLSDLNTINRFNMKKLARKDFELIIDLLWCDPSPKREGLVENKARGVSWIFGPDVTEKFLKQEKLKLLIRSHEMVKNGYDYIQNKMCITVHSSTTAKSIKAAYVRLDNNLEDIKFFQYDMISENFKGGGGGGSGSGDCCIVM